MCRDGGAAKFIMREQDLLKIKVLEQQEEYQIIRNIEFTSDRKMMSVIVKRMTDGKYFNFVKGADMAIVPRILNKDAEFEENSIQQMDDLACQGLRTLMFAVKQLDASQWNDQSIKDADEKELECDLTLLGVTALEDLLQENCKQCITDFRAAKIKVWMLTGDKGETAQNVGISCGIIDDYK